MNIKILYDNHARDGFQGGWGFAALVDNDILFDTGESTESLLFNMQKFGADPACIRHIVISHEDWDHINGIGILKECGAVNVYVPAGIKSSLKKYITLLNSNAVVIEALDMTSIDADRCVLGTLGSAKKEISLAVRGDEGLVLVTGCAHPGLDVIMDKARAIGDIRAVVGGFHDFDRLDLLADIKTLVPCHCTKKKEEIAYMFPEHTLSAGAGTDINI